MKRKNIFFIAAGALFLLVALVEWLLCFYGPLVLEVKSSCYIYPLYSSLPEEEKAAVQQLFTKAMQSSRRYIVVDPLHAEKVLEENGTPLSVLTKRAVAEKYADAAAVIGAETFIMGYVLKINDGYEIMANIHHTKLKESVKKEIFRAPSLKELTDSMRSYVAQLDGEKKQYSLFEILYFYCLLFYVLFGLYIIFLALPFVHFHKGSTPEKISSFVQLHFPEVLFIYTLFLYVFAFLYASNANMDYVQRFMATGGNLRLAASTAQERLHAGIRYIPLLVISAAAFLGGRLKRRELGLDSHISGDFRALWALPMTLLAAILTTLAHPNSINLHGFTFLGYFSLVPLFLVLDKNRYWASVFYGVSYGVMFTAFTNFWLGTFSLVSLQVTLVVFLGFYLIYMIPAVFLYQRVKVLRWLIFPLSWVIFSAFHSTGFLGYPWCLVGTSQYDFLPLIQIVAFTGVWGIVFIIVLTNSVITMVIESLIKKEPKKILLPVTVWAVLFFSVVIGGLIYLGVTERGERKSVKIALIQDSLDPRKHSISDVLNVLIDLSREALKEDPQIIAWPEGSFNTDYQAFPDYDMVKRLKEFQKESGVWLITGSMEYKEKDQVKRDQEEGVDFNSYNSSMLLDEQGEVRQIYHKIHLVPFTEHFPYEKEFPWLYKMLKDFDINWWEKGDTRIRFEHPDFSFFTPICFEDVFGSELRLFVKEGADVILNLSNDYWSQSPVEGKQHTVNSLFRAVENRRPFVRSTTSGLTCYIDSGGRIRKSLPHYEPGYLVADVELADGGLTFYTRYGNWFVWGAAILLGMVILLSLIPYTRKWLLKM